MELVLYSDLHYGVNVKDQFDIPDGTGNEVLVLPGDVCDELDSGIDKIKRACDSYRFVVFVPGNHEYHNKDMASNCLQKFNDEINRSNFVLLDNDRIEIDGVRFIGTTLWSNLLFEGSLSKAYSLRKRIRDFKKIHYGQVNLSVEIWQTLHEEAVSFLEKYTTDKSIIVTHFLPSYKTIATDFVGNEKNMFFASNLDDLIIRKKPKAVLFGHTHYPVNIYLEDSWLLNNSYGYRNKGEGLNFNPSFLINV